VKKLALLAILAFGCSRADGGTAPAPSASAAVPTIEIAKVTSKQLDTTTHLEGELTPWEHVDLYARANGYVSRVLVDRGSHVKKGELLVALTAPELDAQRAEAQAKLAGDKATYDRLKAASATPGTVADNEVDTALAKMRADQSRVASLAATESYLTVTAPFDGVVTERDVDPGALVGPSSGKSSTPMLRMEQVRVLRLTVPVPESLLGALAPGASATFTVQAFPDAKFGGVVRRVAESLDVKTRSMPVELDVANDDGRLAPGMFADVLWPVKRQAPTLFVPASAVVESTEKTFVVRIANGVAEQVPVKRGVAEADLVEIFGPLAAGDTIAKHGSEELRNGTHVVPR